MKIIVKNFPFLLGLESPVCMPRPTAKVQVIVENKNDYVLPENVSYKELDDNSILIDIPGMFFVNFKNENELMAEDYKKIEDLISSFKKK